MREETQLTVRNPVSREKQRSMFGDRPGSDVANETSSGTDGLFVRGNSDDSSHR